MKFPRWKVWSLWLVSLICLVGTPSQAETPEEAFRVANQQFDLGHYTSARDLYAQWLKEHVKHVLRPVVAFNAGLANERLLDWKQAVARYRDVMEMSAKSTAEFKDALYRALFCYEQLGDWKNGLLTVGALEGYPLSGYRVAEFGLRRWFLEEKRATESKGKRPQLSELSKLYDNYLRMRQKQTIPSESQEIFSRAALTLARMQLSQFQEPKTQSEFEARAQEIDNVQRLLFHTLGYGRFSNRREALDLLGGMYETWIRSGLSLSPPATLGVKEKETYLQEMKRELLPLYERVVAIYEKEYAVLKISNADGLSRNLEEVNAKVLRVKGAVAQWKRELSPAK